MEDLLECSVCMESYEVSGDKVPRVFPCQHTFCHSCVRNLVKKKSVACPTCRRRHKCFNVTGVPRNLTLLQLLEHGTGKSDGRKREKPKYCTSCIESFVFCGICCDASMCEDCLAADLRRNMEELKRQLDETEELCSSISTVEAYWKEAHELLMTIIRDIKDNVGEKSGYSRDVELLSGILGDTHQCNLRWHFALLQDCVKRFRSFHEECGRCLKQIHDQVSNGALSCSIAKELSLLREQCDYRQDEVKTAKASAFQKSIDSYLTLINVGEKKLGIGLTGPQVQDQPQWFHWNQMAKMVSSCFNSIIIWHLAWLAVEYLHESICFTLPLSEISYYFCSVLPVIEVKKIPAIALTFAILGKLFTWELSKSLPQQFGPPSDRLKLDFANFSQRFHLFLDMNGDSLS